VGCICNICGDKCTPTRDHVPPKGSMKHLSVKKTTLNDILSRHQDWRFSQNGIHFSTICASCNNKMGSQYDHVYNSFAHEVRKISELGMFAKVGVRTQPQLLMRAILGHLLSAKDEFSNSTFDNSVRNILFDVNSEIPDDINIFYWHHPHSNTNIARDIAMPTKRGDFSSFSIFHVLKSHPVAYLVSDAKQYENLPRLSDFKMIPFNEHEYVEIDFSKTFHPDWPNCILSKSDNMVFIGQDGLDSIYAIPK